MKPEQTVVFADYNCPFCFALHERICNLGIQSQFDWRLVQHAPHIKSEVATYEDQVELASEVSNVRKRAPEITISLPTMRPNSGPATAITLQAAFQYPEKVEQLKHTIYKALWLEGADISRKATIDAILQKLGIALEAQDDQSQATMMLWQRQWEKGQFSRRIPSMQAPDGNVLLGFPTQQKLLSFLETGEGNDPIALKLACEMVSLQRVLFVHDNSESSIHLREILLGEYLLEDTCNASKAILDCQALTPPDLVVIDASHERLRCHAICREVKSNIRSQSIPIIVVTNEHDADQEVRCFDLGVSDYIQIPCNPKVVRARLKNHLKLKRSSQLLEKLAKIDPLTHIRNRLEFERVLELEWRRAIRNRNNISLIMMDIDDFKKINDTHGHQVGDDVLQQMAAELENALLRATDAIFRYGGEEFVAILSEMEKPGAEVIAKRFKDTVENMPLASLGENQHITISQGLCTLSPTIEMNPGQIVSRADEALLQAKANGKNCYVIAEAIDL